MSEPTATATVRWHSYPAPLDPDRGVWIITANCPGCCRQHTHGGGDDPRVIRAGNRTANCASTPQAQQARFAGYNLHLVGVPAGVEVVDS